MLKVRAIVVPFESRKNEFSSTFLKCLFYWAFVGVFPHPAMLSLRSVPVFPYSTLCKNVLILRNSYSFRESLCNFTHLFRMPLLVRGNHFYPFIDVQHAQ